MEKLTAATFERMRAHLFDYARPLDQARFRFHFEGGSAASVLAELAKFQNEDGGFGHALEPDLRAPASSVIATSQGCSILHEVAASADEAIVQGTIRYLLQTYDPARKVWPIVPPAVEEAPHAPWWTYADSEKNFGHFLVNPRAAVLGHLYDYPSLVADELLRTVTDAVSEHVEQLPDPIDMHDFHCLLGLASAGHTPEDVRAQVLARLRRTLPSAVEQNPAKWGQYNLQPLEVAPQPDAPLAADLERDLLEANLDYLIRQLAPEGVWPLPWNWSFVDAQAWAQSERDWQGAQAVNRLLVLRAYGRIEGT